MKKAECVRDYAIRLRLNDGADEEIGLESELEGEVFGPLIDKQLFRKFHVDPELGTIVWETTRAGQ